MEPTPDGMRRYKASVKSLSFSRMSGSVKLVAISRQPQLMSYPTPPGDTTPVSRSKAATPPMGKPYPQWTSGMASEKLTMPGR